MHAPSQSASPSSSSLQCNALSNTLSTGLGFLIARNMDKMTTVVCIVCIAFLFILFFYYFKFILWFFVCTSTVLRKHFLPEQQHSSCIVKSPSDTLLCVFVAVCVCVCICECLLLVSECVFVQLSFFICRSYFIILCAFYCSRSGFWFILNKSHLLFNLLFVAFYQNVCIYKSQQATWTSIDIRSLIIGLRWRRKKRTWNAKNCLTGKLDRHRRFSSSRIGCILFIFSSSSGCRYILGNDANRVCFGVIEDYLPGFVLVHCI